MNQSVLESTSEHHYKRLVTTYCDFTYSVSAHVKSQCAFCNLGPRYTNGGCEGSSHPSNMFKFPRKLVKSQPYCKSIGPSIFCYHFVLVTIMGQLVKTPPPTEGASAHRWFHIVSPSRLLTSHAPF